MQDRCMVCIERTIGSEVILAHPTVPLYGEAQVEAYFGPFRDSAYLETRELYSLRRTYHRLKNHFGRTDGTPR
jgi:hypothetical protein